VGKELDQEIVVLLLLFGGSTQEGASYLGAVVLGKLEITMEEKEEENYNPLKPSCECQSPR